MRTRNFLLSCLSLIVVLTPAYAGKADKSGANFWPAVSPDGRFIVFVSTRSSSLTGELLVRSSSGNRGTVVPIDLDSFSTMSDLRTRTGSDDWREISFT